MYRVWPIVVFACSLCVFVALEMHFQYQGRTPIPSFIMTGIAFGYCITVVPLVALLGRHWMSGWFISIWAVCAIIMSTLVEGYFTGAIVIEPDPTNVLYLVPQMTLAAASPLMAMRNLCGWSFTLRSNVEIEKRRASIEDLFLLGVTVAACTAVAVMGLEALGGPPQGALLFVSAVCFALGLLTGLPAVSLAFLVKSRASTVMLWILYTAMALGMVVLFAHYAADTAWEDMAEVAKSVGAASLVAAMGYALIHVSGFRLTRFTAAIPSPVTTNQTETPLNIHPLEATEPAAAATQPMTSALPQERARWYPRLMTGLVLVCAMGILIRQQLATYQYKQFWTSVKSLITDPDLHIADVRAPQNKVCEVTVDPEFDDTNLQQLIARYPELTKLCLADSRVTGQGLKAISKLRVLMDLDLSYTTITDEDLSQLNIEQLNSLKLAGTKLSIAGVKKFTESCSISDLDISHLGITDRDLVSFSDYTGLENLSLAGNPVTDQGLIALESFPSLMSVDLSDTSIDGSGLLTAPRVKQWKLDGTKITDANLVTVLNSQRLGSLSICRTGITAAALPVLANSMLDLRLGEGAISEQDLIDLPTGSFSVLRLNHKKFTGACMGTGRISCSCLDLSDSGVTENELASITSASLMHIDLSHTKIPTVALGTVSVFEIAFYGNPINVGELLEARSNIHRVLLRSSDLTADQIARLRSLNNEVKIDEEPMFIK